MGDTILKVGDYVLVLNNKNTTNNGEYVPIGTIGIIEEVETPNEYLIKLIRPPKGTKLYKKYLTCGGCIKKGRNWFEKPYVQKVDKNISLTEQTLISFLYKL